MLRALILAMLALLAPVSAAQNVVLRITVVLEGLPDADKTPTPVPRHTLLISDNPPTAPPRVVVTARDGTASVRLRPGNYTVESDKAVVFHGRTYQWIQTIDVGAQGETVLDLTAANAEVASATAATPGAAPSVDVDPSSILMQWQDSVVALWTPTARASGFVFDARGLIATSQRAIGTATAIEVQLTPAVKVAARILTVDTERDVAILWIDARAAAAVKPVPLRCDAATAPVANGQRIFAVGAPIRQQKDLASALVMGAGAHTILADLVLAVGSAGGPVFTADGALVGMTSVLDQKAERTREAARVIRIADVCETVASSATKMTEAAAPEGTRLPVEPLKPFAEEALKDAAQRRTATLAQYHLSASAFDVLFITPVLTYGARERMDRTGGPDQSIPGSSQSFIRPLLDFSNWSEYVADYPPVVLIRATPKMVEGFWTKLMRGAVRTQGVALPPIKHFTSGFDRMRAFCGDTEVRPIHPFRLEQRIGETEAIYEGLYAYDVTALGPSCASVKLVLFSEKDPQKGDTRVVDPKVIQQVWTDFAAYRALK